MTKIKKSIVALFIVLGAGHVHSGMAGEDPEVKVLNSAKSGVYKLIYESADPTSVYMRVMDSDKHLLTYKKIEETNGFMQPLDFSNMPTGKYWVEVSANGEKSMTTIEHKSLDTKSKDFEITSLGHDKKVSILTSMEDEKLFKLYIYDTDNTLLYKEDVSSTAINNKMYNLSAIDTKSVIVVLAENGRTILEKTINF